jgi:hypothetical protein
MLIPAAMAGFLSVRHYRDQALALDETALAAARQAGDRPGEGRALNLLASSQIGPTTSRLPTPLCSSPWRGLGGLVE